MSIAAFDRHLTFNRHSENLPSYVRSDAPLFPLLMELWLDQCLPFQNNDYELAA